MNFPFYSGLTKTNNLLIEKREIKRKIDLGISAGIVCGVYESLIKKNYYLYFHFFHILGSSLWIIPYLIFFELILLIFSLIDKILKKNNYKKLIDCFHLFMFIPGINHKRGNLIEI